MLYPLRKGVDGSRARSLLAQIMKVLFRLFFLRCFSRCLMLRNSFWKTVWRTCSEVSVRTWRLASAWNWSAKYWKSSLRPLFGGLSSVWEPSWSGRASPPFGTGVKER